MSISLLPQLSRDGRPLLSVSLDLDNMWSYMKTHGDEGWEAFPTYLPLLSELVLQRLVQHELTITFFIVGQDAALDKNHQALAALSQAGHEIANHSFHHEPWLQRYDIEKIEAEIGQAQQVIEEVTGQRPRGFRGPGFSLSNDTLRTLVRLGYHYDASTFPTYLGPIARAYYFWHSRRLSEEEHAQREHLFGDLRDGLRPIRPYQWDVEGQPLVEIPVTTMPFFRIPMHLSYVIYLARVSKHLALSYLMTTMTTCRLAGVNPSLLLHPLDFLGGDKVRELSFFPGMDLDTDFKLRFFDEVIHYLKSHFTLVTMADHAQALRSSPQTLIRRPLEA